MVERDGSPETAGEDAARRHRRASDLFLELIERPASERPAALARIAAEDSGLAREVELLLAADAATASHPLDRPAVAIEEPEPAAEPLATVGGERSYRLLGEIGRGGMGVVHLAERADGEFRQRVAIKLLQGGAARGDEMVHRFRTERQILAALDHPGIAKLLDGGTLADGTPFLVMELVEGRRIDEYCRERALPTSARVRLFLEVCAAVEAAHRRLIVHRDLKPSNILVTADGVPKLLDFGIAKLLGPLADEWTHAESELGAQPLTFRYASPEQVQGEPISTATDVYSLGVVLYELLTACHPYGEASTPAELLAAISDREPVTPSTAVTRAHAGEATTAPSADARRLRAELSGDLDAVLLKALRKEPGARYGSVESFAEDLRRHLDGRPVSARRGSTAYRTWKLARRHRTAVALAALVVISLVALAATSVVASRRIARERDLATRERDLAKRERDTARAVTDFMIRFIGAADPNRSSGEEPSLRSAVEDGTRRLESELTREPELRSLLLSSVARVHANLGANQRSAELLELALRDSAKVRSPRSPEHLTIQARLGFTYSLLGRYDEAEKLLRPAVEGLADADPPVAQELARARHYLATCLIVSGRFDEGAEISRTAVADYRRSGARPDIEIATLVYNLSWAEAMMEDWEAAALHARESEELFEQSGAATDFSRASLASHRSLIASETGDWDLAEASARLAVELTERAVGPKAPRTYGARSTLAYALCLQGRFAEAEALHRKVLADRRLDANDSPLGIGESLHSLARTLWWKGELDAAESVLRETLEWTRTSGLDPDRSDLMGVYGDLADVLTARGEVDAAIAHARTALTGLEKAGRAPLVPEAKIRVGTLLLGDLSTRGDGLRMIEEGRAAAAAMGKIGRGFLWRALVALGDDAVAHDDALGGRRLYEEALALESALAPGDPRRGQVAKRLADLDAAARLPARAGSG